MEFETSQIDELEALMKTFQKERGGQQIIVLGCHG
jgi:hypothetical protein